MTESVGELGAGFRRPSARLRGAASAALGAFSVFVALLLNILFFHNYPLLDDAAGLALLALAAVALLYGAIYALSNRWLRAFLEGLLIAFALDAARAAGWVALAAGFAVLAFVLWKRRSVLPFVTVIAVVAAASSAAGIGQQHAAAMSEITGPAAAARPPANLPAVVHIILDEHIGLDGLPADNPRSGEVRATLERFYVGHGFRLFPRAHSDFAYTINSIPQILNFGEAQAAAGPVLKKRRIGKLAYFDLLRTKGYKVNVYQSEWLDFCGSPAVAHCLTYQTQSIENLPSLPISSSTKAAMILGKMATKRVNKIAAFVSKRLRPFGLSLPDWAVGQIRVTPMNAANAFDRLNADLPNAQPGEVYFAHILLPHSPFALTGDCRFTDALWMRRERRVPLVKRQDADFDQMLCTLSKVEAAYGAVTASPAGNNFVFIVHGDHGSRITDSPLSVPAAKKMSDADKIANFSALFAVRSPRLPGGLDPARQSVAKLLEAVAQSDFTSTDAAATPGRPSLVNLDDRHHVPRAKISLPNGW